MRESSHDGSIPHDLGQITLQLLVIPQLEIINVHTLTCFA